ncbi:MAG TPA: Gfo/Idh/MocA family oxidoreductase [Tepidisphaeraceae bacterium]|jgi:predicted dehydrogenase
MQLRTAIIGCGLIGNKRAKALGDCPLVAAVDANLTRAKQLAAQFPGCEANDDWQSVLVRKDVDLVIVSTTNDVLAPATLAAVKAGKHVLVEKPAARNFAEIEPILPAAKQAGVVVKVGFNHRFHPAFLKAREIVNSGVLGPLMFVRARYGHGGRLGMEKEWRGNPQIAGGGEMLDQGVHLIDLSRWFLGDFSQVSGAVATFFWDWPVEDNGFALLTTPTGQIAWLHASCTEWKNTFSFEIYGRTGKLHIEGLGGSYGVERLSHYQMLPQMGPPPTTIYEYPGEDTSWRAEFAHLRECIERHQTPSGSLQDAYEALRVVAKLYEQSQAAR